MTTKNKSECICSDDRAGGSFTNGHFDNCPCHWTATYFCKKCTNIGADDGSCVKTPCGCPCHLGDTLKKQEEKSECCEAKIVFYAETPKGESGLVPRFTKFNDEGFCSKCWKCKHGAKEKECLVTECYNYDYFKPTPKVAKQEEITWVGVLRQFLNESHDSKGKIWNDEEIDRIIDIATPKVTKQENECKVCEENKDNTNGIPSHGHAPTPKVATSEKEWSCKWCGGTNTKKPLFGEPTPHESEDWEAEFDKIFELESQGCSECGGTELIDKREIRFPKGKYHCEWDLDKIKDFIRKERERVSSKSYQRGREEGRDW